MRELLWFLCLGSALGLLPSIVYGTPTNKSFSFKPYLDLHRTSSVEKKPLAAIDWEYKRDPSIPNRIQIPNEKITLGTTMPGYQPPEGLSYLTDDDLQGNPRDVLEYVLQVGRKIQMDLCNRNVTRKASNRHVILKQTKFRGCMSLWYTNPPSFACHPSYFEGEIGFSSLFHELAHNLTLNSPANFRLGGKIDGNMNAIISESLANIFQHATIYQILNTRDHYGLSDDLCRLIRDDSIRSITFVREAYRKLLTDPTKYATYNDPATPEDDSFNSFMSIAYVFIEEAEKKGEYSKPVKRMMRLLQTFREEDRAAYQDQTNESFRATIMVAALSYGLETDLRTRFRALGFPVSDEIYTRLIGRLPAQ